MRSTTLAIWQTRRESPVSASRGCSGDSLSAILYHLDFDIPGFPERSDCLPSSYRTFLESVGSYHSPAWGMTTTAWRRMSDSHIHEAAGWVRWVSEVGWFNFVTYFLTGSGKFSNQIRLRDQSFLSYSLTFEPAGVPLPDRYRPRALYASDVNSL